MLYAWKKLKTSHALSHFFSSQQPFVDEYYYCPYFTDDELKFGEEQEEKVPRKRQG